MNLFFIFPVLFLQLFYSSTNAVTKFQKHFEWSTMDFDFGTENERIIAKVERKFVPENNLPVGIEIWYDKIFVTVPRWKELSVPSTLNYVPINSPTLNPRLIPYPNLAANELGNCEKGLSTVYRIAIDSCDRLWVLDTGTFGIGNTTQNPCPYALNIFDLKTDTKTRRYVFRPEDTNDRTFIANIAVEIGENCDDAHAYFSDELGYGLIVYSYKQNKTWRFEHSYFYPDPLKGDFNIHDLNFQWGDEGIFGMSLSPLQSNGHRTLYFSPLDSHREFAVSTKLLKNSTKVEDNYYHDFHALEERGPNSHTTSRTISQDGIQFFNLIDQNAVGCWNTANPYNPTNLEIVDNDNTELIFPADVKIDKFNNVWVLSDKMPRFLLTSLNPNEPNFRLFFAPVEILVEGTVCQDGSYDKEFYNVKSNGVQCQFIGPHPVGYKPKKYIL